jgi:hypothetical protein
MQVGNAKIVPLNYFQDVKAIFNNEVSRYIHSLIVTNISEIYFKYCIYIYVLLFPHTM